MEQYYTIFPVDLGTLISIDKSIFTLLRNQGTKIDVPCLGWVVVGGKSKILVDTGPCDSNWADRYHLPLRKEAHQNLNRRLKDLELSVNDIDIVILTHLHWDHCFELKSFPNATFFVQKTELEYAVAPLPSETVLYEAGIKGVQPPWFSVFGSINAVDGDQAILPGIRVVHLPGHTPGSQGVEVLTRDGLWLIAGDTVSLYENWEGDDTLKHIPGGIYQNLHDFYSSLRKLEAYEGRILPGHELKVLEQKHYPS
jgi:glyoxylase-like metal-dependent hydrolase (beta-lactamase superfamily II)